MLRAQHKALHTAGNWLALNAAINVLVGVCSHSLGPGISLIYTHLCMYTHTLSSHTGLPPLRQGPDSSSRTQTEWGQRAWLIDRLVLRPSVPVQLFLGWGVVGVVGSGLPSQWELGIKGPIQLGCLNSAPVGSYPQEGGGGMLAKACWLPLLEAWPTVCGVGGPGTRLQGH